MRWRSGYLGEVDASWRCSQHFTDGRAVLQLIDKQPFRWEPFFRNLVRLFDFVLEAKSLPLGTSDPPVQISEILITCESIVYATALSREFALTIKPIHSVWLHGTLASPRICYNRFHHTSIHQSLLSYALLKSIFRPPLCISLHSGTVNNM